MTKLLLLGIANRANYWKNGTFGGVQTSNPQFRRPNVRSDRPNIGWYSATPNHAKMVGKSGIPKISHSIAKHGGNSPETTGFCGWVWRQCDREKPIPSW
jgi:hypothetical protein